MPISKTREASKEKARRRKDVRAGKKYVKEFTRVARKTGSAKKGVKAAEKLMWRPENWSNMKKTLSGG